MAQTKGILERVFKLSEKGTTVKTEILAGLTTFVAMAYIIFVNPSILADAGIPKEAAIAATVWSAVIGSAAMGLWANFPVAVAPGMGLNAFFAYYVCGVLGLHWTVALGAVFFSGIVFLLLSVFNIRDKIVHAIPLGVRLGIGPAIGLMLMNIGVGSNVGVYAEGNGYTDPFYVMRDFFGAMTPSVIKDHMGAEYSTMVLTVITMFVGLFVIIRLPAGCLLCASLPRHGCHHPV